MVCGSLVSVIALFGSLGSFSQSGVSTPRGQSPNRLIDQELLGRELTSDHTREIIDRRTIM